MADAQRFVDQGKPSRMRHAAASRQLGRESLAGKSEELAKVGAEAAAARIP
jgi:hypothetical protein